MTYINHIREDSVWDMEHKINEFLRSLEKENRELISISPVASDSMYKYVYLIVYKDKEEKGAL